MSAQEFEPIDLVERRLLDEANVRLAAYARLFGAVNYQVSAVHISSGGAVVEIRRLLAEFFGDGAAKGVPAAPARPLPVEGGQGSGTPDDWPDAHPSWMDPNHELTHYDAFGIPEAQLIDMPGVSSGWYSYTALARRTR